MPNRLLKRHKRVEAESTPLLRPQQSLVSYHAENGEHKGAIEHNKTHIQLLPSPLIKQLPSAPTTVPSSRAQQKPTDSGTLRPFLTPQGAESDTDRRARRSAHRRSRSFSELITSSSTSPFIATQPWRSSETWLALHSERMKKNKAELGEGSSIMPSSMRESDAGWRGGRSGGTFFGADMNVPLPGNSRARTDTRAKTVNLDKIKGTQAQATDRVKLDSLRTDEATLAPSGFPIVQETLLTSTSPSTPGIPFTSPSRIYQHKAQSARNVNYAHSAKYIANGGAKCYEEHSPYTRWHTPIGEETGDHAILPALNPLLARGATNLATVAKDDDIEDDTLDLLPPLLPRTVTRSSSFSSTSRNTTPIPWAQRSGAATPTHSSPHTPSRQAGTQAQAQAQAQAHGLGQSRSRLDISIVGTQQSSPLSIGSSSTDGYSYGTPKTWMREDPSPPRKSDPESKEFSSLESTRSYAADEHKLVTPPSGNLRSKSRTYAGRPQRKARHPENCEIHANRDLVAGQRGGNGGGNGDYRTGYTLRRSTSPHKVREIKKKLFEHEHREHQHQHQHQQRALTRASGAPEEGCITEEGIEVEIEGGSGGSDHLGRSGSKVGSRRFWRGPFGWTLKKAKNDQRDL
ncbi:hypothetical protein IAT40_006356 [Kwoniella sp. CBS 6097]